MYKVLIVDDEEFVRKGISLEVNWHELNCMVVGEAGNGLEGLEAARKFSPDLIISDIRMPKMDGIEMVSKLREENNSVNVIFLTAYSDFSYAQNAIKVYAADYLLKPFEDGELEEAVTRVISRLAPIEETTPFEMSLKKGDKSKYVMEAMEYIATHYSEKDLNLTNIADSVGLSESHLSHMFKKETDSTIANYILQYRMNTACRLLKDCRYKVYEVADMVGYKDLTYFSSTFKKATGITPSEYQDRIRS